MVMAVYYVPLCMKNNDLRSTRRPRTASARTARKSIFSFCVVVRVSRLPHAKSNASYPPRQPHLGGPLASIFFSFVHAFVKAHDPSPQDTVF